MSADATTDAPWIRTKDRAPTRADGSKRAGNVIWMFCDGYVCEPTVEPWDWQGLPSCPGGQVAWMPIPPHSKWYEANV